MELSMSAPPLLFSNHPSSLSLNPEYGYYLYFLFSVSSLIRWFQKRYSFMERWIKQTKDFALELFANTHEQMNLYNSTNVFINCQIVVRLCPLCLVETNWMQPCVVGNKSSSLSHLVAITPVAVAAALSVIFEARSNKNWTYHERVGPSNTTKNWCNRCLVS